MGLIWVDHHPSPSRVLLWMARVGQSCNSCFHASAALHNLGGGSTKVLNDEQNPILRDVAEE